MAASALPVCADQPDRPLRIALLGYRSDPRSGGQGVYIRAVSRALTAMGHTVEVISGAPYPELDEGVTLRALPSFGMFDNMDALPMPTWQMLHAPLGLLEWFSRATGGFAEPATFSWRAAAFLRALQARYDVVHDNQCLGWGLLTLQKLGMPLVTTIHHPITRDRDLALQNASNLAQRLLIRRWYAFLGMQRRVARQLQHIVTVSQASRRDIIEAFAVSPERITVVPNGVDLEVFRPISAMQREPQTIMTTASSEAPLKGGAIFLEAIAGLRRQYPELKVILVGRLRPEGALHQKMMALGLADCIEVVQASGPEEIARLYARASCAVVPSLYEGFGLPAVEAMACCVPVITTDGGALPEVVGEAGVVVPAGDVASLQQATAALLADPQRRAILAQAGRERVEAHYTWCAVAEKLTSLYRRAMLGC